MSMRGMPMGGGMAGPAGGSHTVNLLPGWLGVAGAAMFLLIAAAHLGHLRMTVGERRPWHVLHVLMALGMAAMYAPAAADPFAIGADLWQLLFATAASLAALRWLAGLAGVATANPLWLLTAIDLGAMVYMWSAGTPTPALTWALVAYLSVEAALWVANTLRVLDRGTPLITWRALNPTPEGAAIPAATTDTLIGTLDISVSMTAMAIGMAYMLAAM
jgi:hypothetical protein